MYEIKDFPFDQASSIYGVVWEDLIKEQLLNPSLLPGWLKCTFTAFGISETVNVSVVFENSKPVAFLPYYFTYHKFIGLKLKTLNLGANYYCYHQAIACIDKHEAILSAFLLHHQKISGWDIFQAGQVVNESKTENAVLELSEQLKLPRIEYVGEKSPYLTLNESWQDVLASKARKFRYKVNKREKLFAGNQSYTIKWFNDVETCNDLLNIILHIEEKSWKTSENMDISNNPTEQALYEVLLTFLAQKNLLLCNVLYFKDTPIAYNLCYNWCGKVGQIKTSFDNTFKEESPGAILIEYSLQYLINNGYKEFDFLGDIMPHKSAWAKVTRDHTSHYVYAKNPKASIAVIMKKLINKIKQLKSQVNDKAAKDD